MSSSKNNVNPDHYKTAGSERPGQDINQEIQKQKYAEAQAKFTQTQKKESGSAFIPGSTSDLPDSSNPATSEKDAGQDNKQVNKDDKSSDKAKNTLLNKQQSETKENLSSAKKTDSTRYGFEPIPATAEVDGAFGENEPTGRTASEVMEFYTAEEMIQQAEEPNNVGNESSTSEEDVFNPVLDSESDIAKE